MDKENVICAPERRGRKKMYDFFARAITSGQLPPGTPLENTASLARQFGLSLMSAQRALTELSQKGYLIRQPGKRTFVAEIKPVRINSSRSNCIGVMLPHMGTGLNQQESPYQFQFVQGIIAEAGRRGCNTTILSTAGDQPTIQSIRDMNLRGIVCITPQQTDQAYLKQIRDAGLALVLIAPRPAEQYHGFYGVERDFRQAGETAFAYFRKRGCRQLALATQIHVFWGSHQYMMLSGFAGAAAAAGMRISVIELYQPKIVTRFTPEDAASALNVLRERLTPCDAVLCAEHSLSVLVHQHFPTLPMLGLIDPISASPLPCPCFGFSNAACGQAAVALLEEMISGRTVVPEIQFLKMDFLEK